VLENVVAKYAGLQSFRLMVISTVAVCAIKREEAEHRTPGRGKRRPGSGNNLQENHDPLGASPTTPPSFAQESRVLDYPTAGKVPSMLPGGKWVFKTYVQELPVVEPCRMECSMLFFSQL